jgi:hypothetical protein
LIEQGDVCDPCARRGRVWAAIQARLDEDFILEEEVVLPPPSVPTAAEVRGEVPKRPKARQPEAERKGEVLSEW